MRLYRFRSLDKLLGRYEELKKETIYFSSPEELNDPLEGQCNLYWSGDSIIWRGIFKHYLLCLERLIMLIRIGVDEEGLLDFPVFIMKSDLPTDKYKTLIREIERKFYSTSNISYLCDRLGQTNVELSPNELAFIFTLFHSHALKCICEVYYQNNLFSKEEYERLSIPKKNYDKYNEFFDALIQLKQNKPEELNTLIQVFREILLESDLAYSRQGELPIQNKVLVWDFPNMYVEKIRKIPFPRRYVSCFSKNCTNSSMWGNYANNHTGVCLIFETEEKENNNWLPLKILNEDETGNNASQYELKKLYKVDYESKNEKINYFTVLGQLNPSQLNTLFVDENGETSEIYRQILTNMESWRNDYWDKFSQLICFKTKDWSYEEEYRLCIDDTFYDLRDKTKRSYKYKFDCLKGIIFGINTPKKYILKVIKIIEQKCVENKREEFYFYQATFDSNYEKIEIKEIYRIR